NRAEQIDDVKAAFAHAVVDDREVDEHVEAQVRIIAQEAHDRDEVFRLDDEDRAARDVLQLRLRARQCRPHALVYFHSSAPLRQANRKPTPSMAANRSISMHPAAPSSRNITAHGYMKTTSTSKTMKRIATR